MKEDSRPNPDALLATIQREAEQAQRGKLKIFFGMVAGVGKTFAMLQAAHELQTRGRNVVVGYIETHGRIETQRLLNGLALVPRINVQYRGVALEEMDLDTVLQLKPEYVLVDELAHTNVEGVRHRKRYQDVLELLERGINVFTTLNVQHVESLIDTVQSITGIIVHETVPDSVLDLADEIELIDLPPEELLKRLTEGKVYTAERSAAAAQNFFRKGNLTALREIVLRKTADRVGMDLQDYMRTHRIAGPWKTVARLMVAVSASPYSDQLIRWTRRLADALEAPWVAVCVQTPRALNEEEQQRLKQNLALARELNAELLTTTDTDVAKALVRIAREKNVTQIVAGKSRPTFWRDLLRGGSLVNRLIKESGAIDVYVVQNEAPAKKPSKRGGASQYNWKQYLLSCSAVAVVALCCLLASDFIDYRAVGMFLLFTVSILALIAERGPVFAAATLSAFIWNFFFIPPQFTFYIFNVADALLVGMYFIIALVGGTLTARVRARELAMRRREAQAVALYALAQEINRAKTLPEILNVAAQQINATFNARVSFYLASNGHPPSEMPHPASTFTPASIKEWSVASWVYQNRKPAGRGTNTLPFAEAVYFPLLTGNRALGVIGLVTETARGLTLEQESLLQTFLHQIAIALEREMLRSAAEQSHVLKESERLHKTLLNSISHELRTPLATITGASSSLIEGNTAEQRERRNVLVADIYSAAQRLNRLVKNLLDMTRLESGLLKLNLEWCDASDLINVVLRDLKEELAQHAIHLELAHELPLARMDFVLMERALANIILNAAQHTPPGSTITLRIAAAAQELAFVIEDEGPGFPAEALPHIFEKFYRAPNTRTGGIGLGLSIAHGFVEAHGGTLVAENRLERGARFIIKLPLTTPPHTPEEIAS